MNANLPGKNSKASNGVVCDGVWEPLPADWIVERQRLSVWLHNIPPHGDIIVRRPGYSQRMTPAEAVTLAALLTASSKASNKAPLA